MIKKLPYLLLLTAFVALVFSSCLKADDDPGMDSVYESINSDNAAIRQYLRQHGKDSGLIIHPSGMCFKIIKKGNGRDSIRLNNVPVVIYKRSLFPSDNVIESSLNLPTSFDGRRLKDHIAGWQIGLQQITKDGRIIMYIPSSLAFGSIGVPGSIPPGAILTCEVTLVDIK